MLNSGHRCPHGHGHFHQGFHVGILHHRRHGDDPNNLPHLVSQRDALNTNKRTPAHRELLRRDSESAVPCEIMFVIILRTPARIVSAFLHSDAHVTHSAHLSTSTVQGCEWKVIPSSHQALTCFACVRRTTPSITTTWPSLHLVGASSVSWDKFYRGRTRAGCLAVWRCTSHPQVVNPTCRPCSTPTPTWTRAEQGLLQ